MATDARRPLFPDARLNFAENLLSQSGTGDALVWSAARTRSPRRMSWDELRGASSRGFNSGCVPRGVKPGDRVAAMMPNMPETIAAMLAVSSLGAIWSSCSPDFGPQGGARPVRADRAGRLHRCDGYWYGRQAHRGGGQDRRGAGEAADGQEGAQSSTIWAYRQMSLTASTGPSRSDAALEPHAPGELVLRAPALRPSCSTSCFRSGTTGVPKCIVPSRRAARLIQHRKEHRLHAGHPCGADRFFYFTTCGWMMWIWLVHGLALAWTVSYLVCL